MGNPQQPKKKRVAFLLIDGVGDVSIPKFVFKTPLQVAKVPNLDAIASAGVNGLMDHVEQLPPTHHPPPVTLHPPPTTLPTHQLLPSHHKKFLKTLASTVTKPSLHRLLPLLPHFVCHPQTHHIQSGHWDKERQMREVGMRVGWLGMRFGNNHSGQIHYG
ncbi:hypothetical protein GBA52_010456 [Prunus armeniaca]|nr:hypothetical protein GBA52_010456 [Prunus armeniaca]